MTRVEKRIFKTTWSRYLLNTLATAALITVLMALVDTKQINKYNQGLLIQIGFNIILAVSLNLSAGFLGQLPLGHAGFMSVGAYTAALFTKGVNLPQSVAFPLGVLVGAFVAFLFGILIGLPALRLKGDYLAIITLGFSEIIRVIIQNLDFTGGAAGLRKIPKYTTVGWTIFWVVVTLFLICTLIKSRHGRAILSIREDEIAAEASGVSTTYYKVTTFALSAAFAGVAGALYAHYMRILDPAYFDFMKSAEILVMVVLGGMGSIIGSVFAATVLTLLPEWLRDLAVLPFFTTLPAWVGKVIENRMIIYALVLVLVMIFKPSGLFGRYDFSLGKELDRVFRGIRRLLGLDKRSGKPSKGGEN